MSSCTLDMLNERQREAAMTISGPVLILAGAGSGKTRTLINRIAYLIDEGGVDPWNILAITFTNKAAEEMRNRVDESISRGASSIWVATFHSTCVRILRRFIDKLGYDTNFTIYDTDDTKVVMKDICKRLQIDTKQYSERGFLNAISKAKDELISPLEMKKDADLSGDYGKKQMARVYLEYERALQKNNALDFDDLIYRTVELFKAWPDILENYQERFRYIMVDEYQDTNTAQFELIRLLASKYRNICVVGDDDQSIYRFRGANIRNILDFEKVYNEAKVVKLEQNYRSTQTVLDAANAVIKNNMGRKDKALWTDKIDGSRIHLKQFDRAYEEAEYIVSDINKKKRNGIADYSSCAVLYRTNAQARILEEQFVLSGTPYDVVGGVNFYSRKEIKDVLAYLKTVDNAKDDLAVKRIINVPKRSIGATTVAKVQDYADLHEISFYDALKETDEISSVQKSAQKLKDFVEMIQTFRSKLQYISISELARDILDSTGYMDSIDGEDKVEIEARKENIQEFINKIIAYEQEMGNEATLSGFLEEVALVADIDRVSTDNNKVLLMTLHSAKGLEFEHVYLSGMEDGLFPSYLSITSDDPMELEEERRLCYVGITRAKDDLTITAARSRMVNGQTQYNALSRFVKEIPEDLFDGRLPSRKVREEDIPSKASRSELGWQVTKQKPYAMAPKERNAYAKPYIMNVTNTQIGKAKNIGSATVSAGGLEYEIGDRVRHMKFGEGTVMNIVSGGRDYEVTVDFDTAGIKKMFAAFAKLKKVD